MPPTTDRSARLSAFYLNFLLVGVVLALAWVLLFPALPAVDMLLWSPSLEPPQDLNPLQVVLDILHQTDSGGQQASGGGLLRGVILSAAGLWMMRLRRLSPGLTRLIATGSAFLAVALISALTSLHVHDALLSWLDYFTAALAFLVAADVTCELRARGWQVSTIAAWFVLITAILVMPAAIIRFQADQGKDYGAMVGSFFQPNMFSSYLEFGLGAGLALYFGTRRGWVAGLLAAVLCIGVYRSYSQGALVVAWAILHLVLALLRSKKAFFLTIPALIVLAATTLAGFRVSPLLLVVAGLGEVALLAWLLTRRRGLQLVVLLALAALLTSQVTPEVAKVDATQQALTVAKGTDVNVAARFLFYRGAVEIFLAHPWLGVGPQGFQRYYPAVQADVRFFSKFTHCIWLTVLSETGLLGLIPFVAGAVLAFWTALRRLDPPRIGLLVGCLGFVAHSTLDVQWEFMALPLTLAILMGVLVGETVDEAPDVEDEAPRSEWSIRPGLFVNFLGAVALFGLVALNLFTTASERLLAAGQAQATARHPEIAEQIYRKALSFDPYSGENHRFLSLLLLARMKTPEQRLEVRRLALRAASLDRDRPVTLSALGQVLSELGDKEGARAAYTRALQLDPVNYPAFYMELANLEADTGHPERAGEVLAEARKRFPLEALGPSSGMLGFRSEALKAPLAMIYAASGARENPTKNPAVAEGYFKIALELQPDNPDALFGLGVAQYAQGRLPEAIATLEKVDKLIPNFAPCLGFLEQAYLHNGDAAKAAEVKERLAKLAPK